MVQLEFVNIILDLPDEGQSEEKFKIKLEIFESELLYYRDSYLRSNKSITYGNQNFFNYDFYWGKLCIRTI